MSKTMKILLSIVGFIAAAIAVSLFLLYRTFASIFIDTVPNHVVKDYVEETHGFEIDIVERDTDGIMSPTEFTVTPEKNKEIRFTVTIDSFDHTVLEDDYQFALEADKEYQKLKPIIPAIEKLGFTQSEYTDFRISYIGDSVYWYLRSDQEVNYSTFVEEELDRYYELYKLVKESQADLQSIHISDANEENGISIALEPSTTIKNKEEFLIDIKSDFAHIEIVNIEVEEQLAEEVKQVNNERFHFGTQYEPVTNDTNDSWLHCTEVNENAECTSAIITITYQENSFNTSNPYLKEDLTSILNFIDTYLEPEIKVESIQLDGSNLSGEDLDIEYEERMKYESVDELIDYLLNKE